MKRTVDYPNEGVEWGNRTENFPLSSSWRKQWTSFFTSASSDLTVGDRKDMMWVIYIKLQCSSSGEVCTAVAVRRAIASDSLPDTFISHFDIDI